MHRLTENQIVHISPGPESRVSGFECYVVAIDGDRAWLAPVRRVDVLWLPERLRNVLMLFAWRRQTVLLKGVLSAHDGPEDLSFRVSDGIFMPRARSSRVGVTVPAVITEIDGAGRRVGQALEAQTHDIGPDGILLEPDERFAGRAVMSVALTLPEDTEPLRARIRLGDRDDDGRVAATFVELPDDERARLRAFVAGHLRWRLKLLRSAQELGDDRD